MKKYYAERNGLITKQLQIDFMELLNYFEQIYLYFNNKDYFEIAFNGISKRVEYTNEIEQIVAPSMAPSPEVYFTTRLQRKNVWPILEYLEDYDEAILFSVIEILYDHIAIYNEDTKKIEREIPKKEFVEQINNVLRAYKDGYYLEPNNGIIMKIPNIALREQLKYDGSDLPKTVYEQLETASKMYYRFDANLEEKKKAINILADILEKERNAVKEILENEYEISEKEHDKLIFGIVNKFNIRHNNKNQIRDYSRETWYDWMMQYYTSVIITFYKLKNKYSELKF